MNSNPEHLNQIGCHINTAVFLEISVFGQGTLVLPLRKGGFRIVCVPEVVLFLWNWQQFNLFVKSSAGIFVLSKTFPGIYSGNCCNTR